MKNIFKSLLCVVMAVAVIACLVACGPSEPATPEEAEQRVAEYVEANKEAVEAASSNEVLSCEFVAEGTSIVYKFTFADLDEVTDEVKTSLEESFDSMTESLNAAFDQVQNEEPAVEAMIHQYYESDGDLILSREFK